MSKEPFEEAWKRILAHEGEIFDTKTHFKFTYKIKGNCFSTSRTHYYIGKRDIEKAYGMVPIDKPGTIRDIIRGYAYVWAVLHDKRISREEW